MIPIPPAPRPRQLHPPLAPGPAPAAGSGGAAQCWPASAAAAAAQSFPTAQAQALALPGANARPGPRGRGIARDQLGGAPRKAGLMKKDCTWRRLQPVAPSGNLQGACRPELNSISATLFLQCEAQAYSTRLAEVTCRAKSFRKTGPIWCQAAKTTSPSPAPCQHHQNTKHHKWVPQAQQVMLEECHFRFICKPLLVQAGGPPVELVGLCQFYGNLPTGARTCIGIL